MKLGGTTSAVVIALFAGTMVSCGGGSKPATPVCAVNSDCAKYQPAGLVCALGYCVSPCHVSSDCPNSERCVIVGGASNDGGTDGGAVAADGGAKEQGTACQAPEATSCHYNSQCQSPLVCASDSQCRNQCQTTVDCPGGLQSPPSEVCTVISHLCVDPTIDKDYNPNTMELTTTDAGATGAAGGTGKAGASGQGGAGASGSAGASGGAGAAGGTGATGGASATAGSSGGKAGAGGAAGAAVTPCTGLQTQFSNMSMGDVNPRFTSGTAVHNADTIFMFTLYQGPASADAGTADAGIIGNAIFVQTFDVATGVKRGSAEFAFSIGDGLEPTLNEASIAPTGEIVLIYGNGPVTNAYQTQLFATFLSVTPGDGGVAGLKVQKTVQLETVNMGDAHVVWETDSQLFVISWKYQGSGGWYTRVKKYHPSGTASGSGINAVPTSTGTNYQPSQQDDGYVGTSGMYLGVTSQSTSSQWPYLTILDADGLQVGPFVALRKDSDDGNWNGVGGTTQGFVVMYQLGNSIEGKFVPLSGPDSPLVDAGASDAGLPPLATFSFPSSAVTGKIINDDTGGGNGVGAVLLETNGASFVYVTADGSKQLPQGTVLSSSTTAQVDISNYLGSFTVALFSSGAHAALATVSTCSQ